MRIATYLALVVRRVWAKKGILFGSALGATLVVALLVVVPLYEASVLAVDLKFTVDGALNEEVDVEGFSNLTPYAATVAEQNRAIVTDAQDEWLQPWYPTTEERTQTREFLVIPSGPDKFVDFLQLADDWRATIDQAIEDEVPEDEWPSPPYPTPPREATQFRMFTSPELSTLITPIAGDYSVDGSVSSSEFEPLKIMLGEDLATVTGNGVGDTFFIKPFVGQNSVFEYVEVAAIVEATDPNADIWGFDDPSSMVYLDQAVFDQWTAVVGQDESVDPWRRTYRGLPETAATQRWRLPLKRDLLELDQIQDFRSRLNQFSAQVSRESAGAIPTTTFIISLLDAFTTRSVVVGGPILAMLAFVFGGATYSVIYTAA
ncbi:MAG: hypothetical protein KDB69_05705, partial [Acidimicrobiia bacterium]|nr:hypothetical protein [Acidimicrobiia bacterium]